MSTFSARVKLVYSILKKDRLFFLIERFDTDIPVYIDKLNLKLFPLFYKKTKILILWERRNDGKKLQKYDMKLHNEKMKTSETFRKTYITP